MSMSNRVYVYIFDIEYESIFDELKNLETKLYYSLMRLYVYFTYLRKSFKCIKYGGISSFVDREMENMNRQHETVANWHV